MSQQGALFEVAARPLPAPEPKDSPTVRRTKRQAALLAAGRHPLSSVMGRSLFLHASAAPAADRAAEGRRCGNCRFREVIGHHSRSYPKCVWPGYDSQWPRASQSEATDVRAWWPGCTDHEHTAAAT
jgi:hypothetical protein